jgi:hypothetical protein
VVKAPTAVPAGNAVKVVLILVPTVAPLAVHTVLLKNKKFLFTYVSAEPAASTVMLTN